MNPSQKEPFSNGTPLIKEPLSKGTPLKKNPSQKEPFSKGTPISRNPSLKEPFSQGTPLSRNPSLKELLKYSLNIANKSGTLIVSPYILTLDGKEDINVEQNETSRKYNLLHCFNVIMLSKLNIGFF